MQFTVAYDVHASWHPWVEWTIALLLFAFICHNIRYQCRLIQGLSLSYKVKQLALASVGFIMFSSMCLYLAITATQLFLLRFRLDAGQVVERTGTITNFHFETTGGAHGNSRFLFDVDGQTLTLPFFNPQACLPRNGDLTRIWYVPEFSYGPTGTPTHQVLRMEWTKQCYIRPWGGE